MHIPITSDRWTKEELDSGKDRIWTEIKRSFNIEDNQKKYCFQLAGKRHRGWRSFLINKFLKDEQGNFVKVERPMKYGNFITPEEWDDFVGKQIDDNDFKKVSEQIAREHQNPRIHTKKGVWDMHAYSKKL
ncbi:uncharacterized protein LOC131613649 [Vicia villosa]|uniref:uncharacterized protein LOC131613649 n=1 Tax=Vicia villosa TaxID=3911 RepID=UPI00273A79B7|nr:uncharacterized protein LOC131613649 [Vicia villosa]